MASASGYVSYFELYHGKDIGKRSEFGSIGDSVIRLCHDIHGNNHKLFMDNLFTTLSLLRHLREAKIFVIGTLRIDRIPKIAAETLGNPKS